MNVFKIAENAGRSLFQPGAMHDNTGTHAILEQFCVTEEWSADLEEGTIALGRWAAALHGVDERHCGLAGVARAYDAGDRRRIVGLFEQASAAPSSFCFSSTITLGEGRRQPVFCMARSMAGNSQSPLSLSGVFLFPRFKLDGGLDATTPGPIARFA